MVLSGLCGFETVYARVALAGGFLTSVTDRFGLMGASGLEERGVGRYATHWPLVIMTVTVSYLHGNFEPLVPGRCNSSLWHPGDGIGDCTVHPAARWISNAHGS